MLKLDYSVVIDEFRMLMRHEFRQYLTGGVPPGFELKCCQRRAQLESADDRHKEWARVIGLAGPPATWTVEAGTFVDTLAKLATTGEEKEIAEQEKQFLTAWLSAAFPDIVFRCLAVTNAEEDEPAAVELATIANLALDKFPWPEEVKKLPESVQNQIECVEMAMDGLRGLAEPFPGVDVKAVDYVNPEDVASSDIINPVLM